MSLTGYVPRVMIHRERTQGAMSTDHDSGVVGAEVPSSDPFTGTTAVAAADAAAEPFPPTSAPSALRAPQPPSQPPEAQPPTTPCTVVWSRGRPYVLESGAGRPRWMGVDHHGRPQALTGEELRRRGWSYRRSS
ncbi:hypothetical protein SacxiDRAFT_3957 [Saccharomonospora xinjiangensis XJ-54]|uniref:Uncharacterized protein n=2 Tax=Saccharomonospora TaxID=1851 RepID=I0V7P5_9PSEU|nr:hypothetical protein SacxiDRAFT_3957 [Saccharomonospora xinjiangensis XJ-54]